MSQEQQNSDAESPFLSAAAAADADDASVPLATSASNSNNTNTSNDTTPSGCCCGTIRSFLSWMSGWMIAGLGMFSNAYVMLAVGNISGILEHTNSDCWGKDHHPSCSDSLRASFRYSLFIGIIFGMCAGGWIGDAFGRRKGSILTAMVMLIGCIFISASYAGTDEGTFTMYSISLALFGFGAGGEYPMNAAASAERAEKERADRAAKGLPALASDRGKKVVLPFTMQGLGNTVNTLLIFLMLVWFGQTSRHYNTHYLAVVWRLQYALGIVPLTGLLIYRYLYLEESDSWEKMKSRVNPGSRKIFFQYYWHRLIGTAGGWLVWDLLFYGNKSFQTRFIKLFAPSGDLADTLREILYNSLIAYVGYFGAAYTIDKWGRMRLQLASFLTLFVVFTVIGIWYDTLTDPSNTGWLRLLYYISTYASQHGANATTFMFPAEVFPTNMRAFGHGLSGAFGPGLGAMLGGLIFSYVDNRVAMLVCGGCGIVGVILTVLFLPDLTSMNLEENDIFWHVLVQRSAGRVSTYEGEYTQYLSVFEKYCWFDSAIGETFALRSPLLRNAPEFRRSELHNTDNNQQQQQQGEEEGAGGGGEGAGREERDDSSTRFPRRVEEGNVNTSTSHLSAAPSPANGGGGDSSGNSGMLEAGRETSYLSLGGTAM